jgi:hypothetical protein
VDCIITSSTGRSREEAQLLLLYFYLLEQEHQTQSRAIPHQQAKGTKGKGKGERGKEEMPTAVSAPGKVLLAGGYLVLDRAYSGLVFGLSARIHVVVDVIDTSTGVQLSEIVVQSPQFHDASWNYGYHLTGDEGGVNLTQLQG